jgi:hypothetical protein
VVTGDPDLTVVRLAVQSARALGASLVVGAAREKIPRKPLTSAPTRLSTSQMSRPSKMGWPPQRPAAMT